MCLHEILHIFNLQEDYALGLIAQSCNVDKEAMVDEDSMVVLEDKFNPPKEAFICFEEAKKYEKPNEKTFQKV